MANFREFLGKTQYSLNTLYMLDEWKCYGFKVYLGKGGGSDLENLPPVGKILSTRMSMELKYLTVLRVSTLLLPGAD